MRDEGVFFHNYAAVLLVKTPETFEKEWYL